MCDEPHSRGCPCKGERHAFAKEETLVSSAVVPSRIFFLEKKRTKRQVLAEKGGAKL